MSAVLTATMTGEDVIELLTAASEGLGEVVEDQLTAGAALITEVMKDEAPVGVGGDNGLRGSIAFVVDPVQLIAEIKPTVPYADAVESGSRPHMPPVEALTAWATLRGLNPWAVAYSIKKKGTRANPYIARTFDDVQEPVVDTFTEGIGAFLEGLLA